MVQKITKVEEFWLKKILAKNNFDPKTIWSETFFVIINFGQKIFASKIISGPIKFWVLKNLGPQIFVEKEILCQKKF